ncbi:MAG: hypothetical protein HGA80_02545 [Candidatus Omnitrophica bacterium]|nr:hypothetical protein [Candidatus Omnitrophota bacterium]
MGKGYAVRQGMLKAEGDCCIFTDIDLPYDLTAIPYAFHLIHDIGFDCVAGDRTLHYSSDVASRPLVRKLASKVFSRGIALLVIGGIFDSQCGFKAFSRRLARAIFPLLTINRFSFDVELYYLLLKYNIVIRRIPVHLKHHDVSTVSVVGHFWEMTCEVLAIPFKWHSGKYRSDVLADFYVEDKYWEKNA